MRGSIIALALTVLIGTTTSAFADHPPVPVVGEPVLLPDSAFEKVEWGYKRNDLTFPGRNAYGEAWPTIFTMEGYDGASRPAPNAYLRMDDGELMALLIRFGQGPDGGYVSVQASTRGTECSGGQFNLYDRRHAWDGYHIIEWVADQPWSNGKVGMYGQSFPGQTAYFVAATQPPSLTAVAPSLLHSDIYRDIFMPGGVQNILFPTLWTYAAGPHRAPTGSLEEGTIPADEICTQAQATRYSAHEPPQPQNEPAWKGIGSTDDDWYVDHAAITYAPAIKIPYYQQTNWQDEQTGPRAVVLYHHIHPDPVTICDANGDPKTIVPKKFVTSSGGHGHGGFASADRWEFFDIFVRDRCDETGLMDDQVVNYFESRGGGTFLTKKTGPSWPFPDTDWTRLYLRENGGLEAAAPAGDEPADSYASGIARPGFFYEAPDEGSDIRTARGLPDNVAYESEPLASNLTIAGPILLDLYASMTGVDADFFVTLSEVLPDGRISYLQRGLLKASHRQVDPRRSYYADGRLVQPYRPHTNPQPVTPGEIVHYEVEVFPVGHVFRKDSRILVQILTPPVTDGLWGYTATHHAPAVVTVHHSAEHPSSIQLPVVQPDIPVGDVAAACPVPDGFPCNGPSAVDQ